MSTWEQCKTGSQYYDHCESYVTSTLKLTSITIIMSFVSCSSAPTILIIISDSGSPVLGQTGYTLTCAVIGDENLSPTITYQWTRDNGATQTQVGTNSNTLSFSPLSLSDAGRYTCDVTVSSPYITNIIMAASESDNTPSLSFQCTLVIDINPSIVILYTSFSPPCTYIHSSKSISFCH